MAGVDVGSGGRGRRVNQDINMIPFIDLLMVTVAFLLITAVWVNNSRINADAQVPSNSDRPIDPPVPSKDLHLRVNEDHFSLSWRQGSEVLTETQVPRLRLADGKAPRYDDLAEKIAQEWKEQGGHQDPSDRQVDRCVLHTEDNLPFGEIVAVMDALYSAKREMVMPGGARRKASVFNMALAIR